MIGADRRIDAGSANQLREHGPTAAWRTSGGKQVLGDIALQPEGDNQQATILQAGRPISVQRAER